jgi:hypothetical protein
VGEKAERERERNREPESDTKVSAAVNKTPKSSGNPNTRFMPMADPRSSLVRFAHRLKLKTEIPSAKSVAEIAISQRMNRIMRIGFGYANRHI